MTYVEFDGTHMIPTAIASAAVQFILTAQIVAPSASGAPSAFFLTECPR